MNVSAHSRYYGSARQLTNFNVVNQVECVAEVRRLLILNGTTSLADKSQTDHCIFS